MPKQDPSPAAGFNLRVDKARDPPDQSDRLFVGICVASGCRSVTAALVTVSHQGMDARPRVLAAQRRVTPEPVALRYRRLLDCEPQLPGEPGILASQLADLQVSLFRQLLERTAVRSAGITAAGVCDPGLWQLSDPSGTGYVSLCDGARLAEQTGLNVVDAFPARDLAAGGQGGPVMALPKWSLASHPARTRILLDLGRTARLVYLPSAASSLVQHGILAFDIGPGMVVLDDLASQFSGGHYEYDPGGRLAVQGRKIQELIDHWLTDEYFERPPPRWHPVCVQPDSELRKTVEMAIDAGWTVRDLLCTATHFTAESICRAVDLWLPKSPPVDEVLLTGGGRHNGLLLAEIAARLPKVRLLPARDVLGFDDDTLDAAAAALLAMLHVDRVSANPPPITGAKMGRVLGRVTPGSRENWQRLLLQMTNRQTYRNAG